MKSIIHCRYRVNDDSDTEKHQYLVQTWRPRGALSSRVQNAYIVELLCPQVNEIGIFPCKLSSSQQVEIMKKRDMKSLRELAKEY